MAMGSSDVSDIEDITDYDNDAVGQPQKRLRGKGGKGFILSAKERNRYDKRQFLQLDEKLKKWFERTSMPTVCLSLTRGADGEIVVRYSGADCFKDFGRDQNVLERFIEIAASGLEESGRLQQHEPHASVEAEPSTEAGPSSQCDQALNVELERRFVNREGLLNLLPRGKAKLICQIVGKGKSSRECWKDNNKPCWWPPIAFRSPNVAGHNRMKVADMDIVLSAYWDHISSSGDHISSSDDIELYHEMKEQFQSSKWTHGDALDFLKRVESTNDVNFLERVVAFIPQHRNLEEVVGSAADVMGDNFWRNNINFWLRHQVPDSVFGSLEPMFVLQDGNDLFRAVSMHMYGTEICWLFLRLFCAKYGVQRMEKVSQKLKEVSGGYPDNVGSDAELKTFCKNAALLSLRCDSEIYQRRLQQLVV